MLAALRRHWPEYLSEAFGLGLFMLSACAFAVLLEHPAAPGRAALDGALLRRALMGVAMGLTAVAIIYTPLGQRSGAHINPAVTLTFWSLGKVKAHDALFYVAFQFLGGAAGVGLAALLLRPYLADPAVNFVATVPGAAGPAAAFLAEAAISFGLMLAVLRCSSSRRLERYTGCFAGLLVAAYITFEAPLSGMSMNPARSFGSALPAGSWAGWWIYFAAPPAGMQLAALLHRRGAGRRAAHCAKLHHANRQRCIFCGANR